MRTTASVVAALVSLGCDSQPSAHVTIGERPIVMVVEGQSVSLPIDIDNAPANGPCAPPYTLSSFAVLVDDDARRMFQTIQLRENLGSVSVELEARCDAIAANGADVLVDVTVEPPSECAAASSVTIQVSNSASDQCAPVVTAWTGQCIAPPSPLPEQVTIAASETPPPLCVRVASQDPDRERLWIRSESTAPEVLVAPESVPWADEIPGVETFEVPLGDTRFILGRFSLNYGVFREPPGAGATPSRTGSVALTVGQPGLSINLPAISQDPAVELDVTRAAVQIFRLDDEGAGQPVCARAMRSSPPGPQLARRKPFLRLQNIASGTKSTDAWVCGNSFALRFSPPLDAPEVETIRIEASTCRGCATDPTPTTAVVDRTLSVGVRSVAGQYRCGGTNTMSEAIVACANVAGDLTPELVLRRRGGSLDRTCVFLGEEGRHRPIDWSEGSAEDSPLAMRSFLWHVDENVAKPIILGQFADAPMIRVLAVDANERASWQPATELGFAAAGFTISGSAPLSASVQVGHTHLAVPRGRHVELRCISPAHPADCQTVTVSNVVPPGFAVVDIGMADVDGDGSRDVVAFARENAAPFAWRVHVVRVTWTTPGVPAARDRASAGLSSAADRFRVGAVTHTTCSSSQCREAMFAVPLGVTPSTQLIRVTLGVDFSAELKVATVPAVSAVRDVTAHRNRLIIGTDFGVSELVPAGNTVAWLPRDPVVLEDGLVGPTTTRDVGYASSVTSCRTQGFSSIAFLADTASVRYTELDIDVTLP